MLGENYQEMRPRGTCNKCGKPWSPGHSCGKKEIDYSREDSLPAMDDYQSELALDSQEERQDDDQFINML